MANNPVTSVTVTYNVALVTVDNLPSSMKLIADVLKAIAQEKINVDMISQAPSYKGNINVSFTISADDVVGAIGILNRFKKDVQDLYVEIDADNTKLSVYGEGMKGTSGVAAKIFIILAENDIDVKLVTTSETDISLLIYEKDVDKAVKCIKNEYSLT